MPKKREQGNDSTVLTSTLTIPAKDTSHVCHCGPDRHAANSRFAIFMDHLGLQYQACRVRCVGASPIFCLALTR